MQPKIATTPSPTDEQLAKQQLQRMADAVQNEAHWHEILKTASQAEREELERVVGPLLKFRRTLVCDTPDCTSQKEAKWQPSLRVVNPDGAESYVPIERKYCDECKKSASMGDFLTSDIWTQILVNWPKDWQPPVRRHTTLTWDKKH